MRKYTIFKGITCIRDVKRGGWNLCKDNGICLTVVGFVGFSPDCHHSLKFWCKWHTAY